ncbi:hypothetical protein AB0C27_40715 [Nonomuraea sp. NPDC048882]|uniref:ADP-ribosylglycohydrolase family protein n=1 Tax=Nonomuraea sp. NPDC048882 TaxID=3154347 RepID=UPI0033FAC8DE
MSRDEITETIQPVIGEMEDILHHHTADGQWQPYATDTVGVLAEARSLLRRLDKHVRDARAELARIERSEKR